MNFAMEIGKRQAAEAAYQIMRAAADKVIQIAQGVYPMDADSAFESIEKVLSDAKDRAEKAHAS